MADSFTLPLWARDIDSPTSRNSTSVGTAVSSAKPSVTATSSGSSRTTMVSSTSTAHQTNSDDTNGDCVDCSGQPIAECPPCSSNQSCIYTTRTCSSCATAVCMDLNSGGPATSTIVGAAVGSVAAVLLLGVIGFFLWRKRRNDKAGRQHMTDGDGPMPGTRSADGIEDFKASSHTTDSFFNGNRQTMGEKDSRFLSFGSHLAGGRGSVFSALDAVNGSATINQAQVIKPAQASVSQVKPKVVNIELVRSESNRNSPTSTIDRRELNRDSLQSIESAGPSIYFESGLPPPAEDGKRSTQIYEFKRVNTLGRSMSRRGRRGGVGNAGEDDLDSSMVDNQDLDIMDAEVGLPVVTRTVSGHSAKISSAGQTRASTPSSPTEQAASAAPSLTVPPAARNRQSRRLMPDTAITVDTSGLGLANSLGPQLSSAPTAVTQPPSPTVAAAPSSQVAIDLTEPKTAQTPPPGPAFPTNSAPTSGAALSPHTSATTATVSTLPTRATAAPPSLTTTTLADDPLLATSLTSQLSFGASLVNSFPIPPSHDDDPALLAGPNQDYFRGNLPNTSLNQVINTGPSLSDFMADVMSDFKHTSVSGPAGGVPLNTSTNTTSHSTTSSKGGHSLAESTGTSPSTPSNPFSNAHALKD
ncbi:hypothetical protein H4R33_001133 [Dimargaris cristalligena]|uniref:Membrane anchor Opy2 N-terminal domain-containing protein n=1 Tax=Dimargaris cristalligena TaxID=215637 RepID=A0A4P9ZUD0_9FUNG|nr:hypothetical protein H4R33_001133 [Dimargaris cristalligena]RKP37206.1 hypothetical protein BJ085DRAFT_31227 [Dimargaris cristalligena]|eukprot:RKP37206.1 hypothetical protein BJ085DRAFT_31227 [Dimargaris cristalligena]